MMSETAHKDDVPEQTDPVEMLVCPSCTARNAPMSDFCQECGCPISPLAAMDPVKRIFAEGFVYRRAATGPITRTVLIGMWLLFGPVFLVGALFLFVFAFVHFSSLRIEWLPALITLTPPFLVMIVSGLLLRRVTLNYFRSRRELEDENEPIKAVERAAISSPDRFRRILGQVYSPILSHPVISLLLLFLFVPAVVLGWKTYVSGSLLRSAAEDGDVASVRVVLALGANPDLADRIGMTPLHCAAAGGNVEVVRALLEAGANLDARIYDPEILFDGSTQVYDGFTPLHCAAERGHVAVISLLVKSGADVNARNAHGYTPLHEAVTGPPLALFYHGSVDSVRELLALGADPHARTNADRWGNAVTALDLADPALQRKIARLLRAAMEETPTQR